MFRLQVMNRIGSDVNNESRIILFSHFPWTELI